MRPTRYLGLWYLSSWIQDICLDLRHKPEIVYFPRALLGTGKPILFGNEQNFRRFITHQKQGRLIRNYAFLMKMATEPGENRIPRIATQLFAHTNNDYFRIVENIPLPEEVEQFKLFTDKRKRWYKPWVVSRLHEYIISETEIKAKVCEMKALFAEEPIAVAPNILTVTNNVGIDLLESTFKKFIHYWKTNNTLFSAGRPQRYYKRKETEDFLNSIHPMRVDINISWLGKAITKRAPSLEYEREQKQLYEWVVTGSPDNIPTSLIPDDLSLVQKFSNANRDLFCVTNDRKLLGYIATFYSWRSEYRVYRIDPQKWIRCGYRINSKDPNVLSKVSSYLVEIDEGSLQTAESEIIDELEQLALEGKLVDEEFTLHDLQEIRGTAQRDRVIPSELVLAQILDEIEDSLNL